MAQVFISYEKSDNSVAEEVADRIGILRLGRLVALGTFEEIKQQHSNGAGRLEDLFLDLTASENAP